MLDKMEAILTEFSAGLAKLKTTDDVAQYKAQFLGKKGPLTEILKGLGKATPEERKTIGARANEIKGQMQDAIGLALEKIEMKQIEEKLAKSKIDTSVRSRFFEKGIHKSGLHPVTLVRREIEDIFLSMGFEVVAGPHIEDEYHNFEALNIPSDHPARDMTDTFWFDDPKNPEGNKHVLRTHTSSVQIRGMKERTAPFRFIAPGKAFRAERTDAGHEMVFHQLEGMLVDEDVSIGHLIYFMKTILSEIFKKDVEVRLRPGFFPFVEPGFELDIRCLICNGKGCSVCKKVGWVELLPCGMIHPKVLECGEVDTGKYNGFAFGMGLDRLVMMRYAIDDIRHIHSADLRFVSQFS